MSRRAVVDCDGCPAKDIGEKAELVVYEPRQLGEIDGGSAAVALCPDCLRRFVLRAVKTHDYTASSVLATVRGKS